MEKLESTEAHLRKAAEDLKEVATAKANEFREMAEQTANEFREKAETAYSDARGRAQAYQSDAETYIRDNPTKAVLYALGIGFLLGLMIRR